MHRHEGSAKLTLVYSDRAIDATCVASA